MFRKETQYALRGLVYIYRQNQVNRRPGVAEIALEMETPYHFTAKILQGLAKQGFVRSMKGRGGGFYFDPESPDVPIKDIITAIEGERTYASCAFGMKECSCENPCPLHERYAPVRDALNQVITEETVQSLGRRTSDVDPPDSV